MAGPARRGFALDNAGDLLTRHRLTVNDYHRIAEAGILGEDGRVELINGEIIDMAAIGSGHASVVSRMTRALVRSCGDQAIVSVQNPIRLYEYNEPRPQGDRLKGQR